MAFVGKAHLLRVRDGHEAKVSNMELFFDLIYVFAVTQISHLLLGNLTELNALQSLVLWFGVWLAWQYTCWLTNWFDPDKVSMRLMLFTIMFIALLGAVALPHAFSNQNQAWVLGITFASLHFIRNVFVLLNLGAKHPLTPNYRRMFVWGTLTATFWVLGAMNLDVMMRLLFWALAVSCDYFSPMIGFPVPFLGRSNTKEWTVEGGHMAERCQLFVIVALGETLLISGATLSGAHHVDTPMLIAFFVSFISSVAMWWIYFDTSSKDGSHAITRSDDPGRIASYFGYVHVILIAGVIVSAVASELYLAHPPQKMDLTLVVVLISGPAIYLIGNIFYKRIIYNHYPLSHLVGLALLALLIPISFLTDLLMVGILTMLVLVMVAVWSSLKRKTLAPEGAKHHASS
ncbi:low temperature requirement protein A [Bacteriovorax sp. PP10]|uniref:Low temperature requirement protein A n=1 Tax=Bacteriovorax antarcticus TaxID=3088717 RepID=A0ABU5VRJ0_9BACT|nr:low temperature requirement protein A [Bacteriovorax sp. PP10]MEA9355659.1 low temperature requirement protein A [Bacteriovorax sp. PP10]